MLKLLSKLFFYKPKTVRFRKIPQESILSSFIEDSESMSNGKVILQVGVEGGYLNFVEIGPNHFQTYEFDTFGDFQCRLKRNYTSKSRFCRQIYSCNPAKREYYYADMDALVKYTSTFDELSQGIVESVNEHRTSFMNWLFIN